MVCLVASGDRALVSKTPGREANRVTDGVQEVPPRLHGVTLSDRSQRTKDAVSLAVLESVAARILARGGGPAISAAVLTAAPRSHGTDAVT